MIDLKIAEHKKGSEKMKAKQVVKMWIEDHADELGHDELIEQMLDHEVDEQLRTIMSDHLEHDGATLIDVDEMDEALEEQTIELINKRIDQLRGAAFGATSLEDVIVALNHGGAFLLRARAKGLKTSRKSMLDINDVDLPTFGDVPSERARAFAWSWGVVEGVGMCTLHKLVGGPRDTTVDAFAEVVRAGWYLLATARLEETSATPL